MADDRLSCSLATSMPAINSDKVSPRPIAISLRAFQNASSKLTLVLWPAIIIDRLLIVDFFMAALQGRRTSTLQASAGKLSRMQIAAVPGGENLSQAKAPPRVCCTAGLAVP